VCSTLRITERRFFSFAYRQGDLYAAQEQEDVKGPRILKREQGKRETMSQIKAFFFWSLGRSAEKLRSRFVSTVRALVFSSLFQCRG
jgi:hypothetical protein